MVNDEKLLVFWLYIIGRIDKTQMGLLLKYST
jgi:hypothetical protein